MNTKKFHLTSSKENLDFFFEKSREIPLIAVSWPFHADTRHGFIVQLSPTLKANEFFLRSMCKEIGITCEEFKEQPKTLATDFYGDSYSQRIIELANVPDFRPTALSEFAAGYNAAIRNIKQYGSERVIENATSGVPK